MERIKGSSMGSSTKRIRYSAKRQRVHLFKTQDTAGF